MCSLFPHLNLVVHTPEIVYSTDIVVQKNFLRLDNITFHQTSRPPLSVQQSNHCTDDQDWRRRP